MGSGRGPVNCRLHARRQVARGVDAGHGRLAPHRVGPDEAVLVEREIELPDQIDVPLRRMREERVAGDPRAIRELDGLERVSARDQPCDRSGFQPDARRRQRGAGLVWDLEFAAGERHDVDIGMRCECGGQIGAATRKEIDDAVRQTGIAEHFHQFCRDDR